MIGDRPWLSPGRAPWIDPPPRWEYLLAALVVLADVFRGWPR